MIIITRYLAREVLTTLLGVITVLLLAILSQQIVRYLNYVAVGKIPTGVLMQLVSFEVPYLLAVLLPLALYLGLLLTFGRLYADNEMAILQMCGYGEKRLVRLSLMIAGVVTGIVLVLMLWVNPVISAKRQHIMESDAVTLHLIQTLMPGRFQVSPDGRHVMYVEKLSRDHQRAENIFIAKQENGAWTLVSASEGYQVEGNATEDPFFVTTDGYRYQGTPGQNDYQIIQFKKYAVRLPQNDLGLMHMENEALPTDALWQNYADAKSAAELQWRISMGLSALMLALLAAPLSLVRPRRSRYFILVPAVLIYIVYFNLLSMGRHWVEQHTVPVSVGIWWVHGLVLLLVVYGYFRTIYR